jgi:hypothetical protein
MPDVLGWRDERGVRTDGRRAGSWHSSHFEATLDAQIATRRGSGKHGVLGETMLGYGKGEEPEREIELVKYSDTCARPDFPPPFTVTGGNSSRYFHAKQFSPMRRALMALLPGEMLARRRQGMNVSAYKLRNIYKRTREDEQGLTGSGTANTKNALPVE